MFMNASMRRPIAISAALCLLATTATAEEPRGQVIGSFGERPLELSISSDLSEATIIGTYADASFAAAQTEGDQGPFMLTLAFNGELPAPQEVTLDIAFARDMGRNWRGDQDSLTLDLANFSATDGVVSLTGTVTGDISGGPDAQTRPVTLSFDARLEQVN